jgi:DNA helicase-2/ATP-dependent DNA helicase PcrA
MSQNFLEKLNPYQRNAAEQTEGPVLILAGAGSGKTRTITYRIAHLINKGVEPHKILAVTFTNKAASEMRERVNEILTTDPNITRPIGISEKPFIKTFHSLGVHILRENYQKLGLQKSFSIMDRADSKKIVRDALKAEGYDPKEHDPGKILSIISKQKGDMITADEYSDSNNNAKADMVAAIWRIYDKKVRENKSLDFDDLLVETVKLLENDSEVKNYYQNFWDYIHIDEYQDTNEVQYRMTKVLAEKHKNICVVGDVDQNIYSWRGATIKNIMNFEMDYPETKEIILEENYRSTANILDAANSIISKNVVRKDKKLFTKNSAGEKITVYQALDEYDEANFAVLRAKDLINGIGPDGSSIEKVAPNEIAFLYRANYQSRVLEEIALRHNLPHQVIGTRFFDRKEVKDVISYIKASLNEEDFPSLSRIINTPVRGIGKATILKIHDKKEDELPPATKIKVGKFRELLSRIRAEILNKKPNDVIHFVIKESTMEESFKKDGEDGLERLQNVRELASLAKKYDHYETGIDAMRAFLEDVALASDQDEMEKDEGGVKLMTVHAAKGLEFDNVFVTGLEQGLFPMQRDTEKPEDAEEERRLFYVAVTRARKKLFLTHASFRTVYGSKDSNIPSEFLEDIDEKILEHENLGGVRNSEEESGGKMEYLIDF